MRNHPALTRPLNSTSDLAAFHARRERFYSVVAQLLANPPDECLLDAARRLLDRGCAAAGDLVSALGDDRRGGAAREHTQLFPSRTAMETRGTSRLDETDLVSELRHLAILADRLAGAIQSGDMSDAAALSDEQTHVLRDHAGTYITDHAGHIAASGGPFYQALGRALARQIGDDVRLLAAHDVRP